MHYQPTVNLPVKLMGFLKRNNVQTSVKFMNKHSYTDGRGSRASLQLLIRRNLGVQHLGNWWSLERIRPRQSPPRTSGGAAETWSCTSLLIGSRLSTKSRWRISHLSSHSHCVLKRFFHIWTEKIKWNWVTLWHNEASKLFWLFASSYREHILPCSVSEPECFWLRYLLNPFQRRTLSHLRHWTWKKRGEDISDTIEVFLYVYLEGNTL